MPQNTEFLKTHPTVAMLAGAVHTIVDALTPTMKKLSIRTGDKDVRDFIEQIRNELKENSEDVTRWLKKSSFRTENESLAASEASPKQRFVIQINGEKSMLLLALASSDVVDVQHIKLSDDALEQFMNIIQKRTMDRKRSTELTIQFI